MNTIETLKLAHDHMRIWLSHYTKNHNVFDTLAALIEQMEQAESEPVATKIATPEFSCFHVSNEDAERLRELPVGAQLYTTPQPAKAESVGQVFRNIRVSSPDCTKEYAVLDTKLPIGTEVFTTPQPVAPCPTCEAVRAGLHVLIDRVEYKELQAKCAELEKLLGIIQLDVSSVYMAVTNGRCSKENTPATAVIGLFEDYLTQRIEEEIRQLQTQLTQHRAVLAECEKVLEHLAVTHGEQNTLASIKALREGEGK